MQVLVAEDDLASRVLVETALRQRGLSIRNCDDGLEAAKILSGTNGPRIAVLSNSLKRLRGLDICRFLCAVGKKQGTYVILLSDVIEMELVELCRRAGVEDVVTRPVSPVDMTLRLDIALRCIQQEDEFAKLAAALRGLAAFETSSDKRSRELKQANAALLKGTKAGASNGASAKGATGQAPAPSEAARSSTPDQSQRHVRSLNILPSEADEKAASAAPAAPESGGAPSTLPVAPDLPDVPQRGNRGRETVNPLAFGPPEEDSSPSESISGSTAGAGDAQHEDALTSAEQFQNAELAEEEDRVIYPFEFDDIVLGVFSGMGVTLKTEIPPKSIPEGPVYLAWVGIGMPVRGSWLDVLLVCGEEGAKEVTRALLSEASVSDGDICEMLAELQNMTQGALRRHMEENGATLVQIAIPKARQMPALPEMAPDAIVVESGFSFNGQPINAVLLEHKEMTERSKPAEAELYDMLCDRLKEGDTKIEGLDQGTIVRAAHLKLLARTPDTVGSFRVVRPSSLVEAMEPSSLLD